MRGVIFDIQKFSLNDGPGIRTTVFLKGCMMRCKWCHNPESFSVNPQLGYNSKKCVMCGRCMEVCANGVHSFESGVHKVDFDRCIACGKCVSACMAEALVIYGRDAKAEDVIREVMQDEKYYRSSGGGVTFSGGEPTMQMGFLLELIRLSKENNLHVCLETNGYMKKDDIEKLIPFVDLWLFDYKSTGEEKHKELTGVRSEKVMQNLDILHNNNSPVILRCPMIPNINDDDIHFAEIASLKRKYLNIIEVQIMPYHNFGTDKWRRIGLESPIDLPNTPKDLQGLWKSKL